MVAAMPARDDCAPDVMPVHPDHLTTGDVLRLRSEAASPETQDRNRRWAVVGVIDETDEHGRIARRYRVRASYFAGKTEREVSPVEVLPGSVERADPMPVVGIAGGRPVLIAAADVPAY